MGNLGMYQFITTVSKRVGGPRNFIIIVAATGYGLGKAVEFGVKFIKDKAGRNYVKNECKDITR